MSTTLPQVELDLREAAEGLSAAKSLIEQGRTVQLTGLEKHIAKVCEDVGALPSGDQQRIKPRLVALIDDLNTVAEILTSQHDQMSAELTDLSKRHRAMSAYKTQGGKPPGTDGNT